MIKYEINGETVRALDEAYTLRSGGMHLDLFSLKRAIEDVGLVSRKQHEATLSDLLWIEQHECYWHKRAERAEYRGKELEEVVHAVSQEAKSVGEISWHTLERVKLLERVRLCDAQSTSGEDDVREQECKQWGSGRTVGDCMADGDCHEGCPQGTKDGGEPFKIGKKFRVVEPSYFGYAGDCFNIGEVWEVTGNDLDTISFRAENGGSIYLKYIQAIRALEPVEGDE